MHDTPKSSVKGVYWNRRGQVWLVEFVRNYKRYYFGQYKSQGKAEAVAKKAIKTLPAQKRKLPTSGVHGVHKRAGGWAVVFNNNKQRRYLGMYKTIAEAKKVADANRTTTKKRFYKDLSGRDVLTDDEAVEMLTQTRGQDHFPEGTVNVYIRNLLPKLKRIRAEEQRIIKAGYRPWLIDLSQDQAISYAELKSKKII